MARLSNCCLSHPSPGLSLEIQRSPGLLQFNQEFVPNISHTQHIPSPTILVANITVNAPCSSTPHYPQSTPPLVCHCTAIVPSWSVACCVNVCGPLFGFAHVYNICCTIAIWYIIQYALSYCCVWSPLSVSSLDWQLAIWQSALPAICKSSTREKFSTIAFVCPLDKGQI